MDLNQLYFDHQLLQMQADRTRRPDRRILHLRGAALIAGRIGCMQRASGAGAADGWSALAEREPDRIGLPQPLPSGPPRGPFPFETSAEDQA